MGGGDFNPGNLCYKPETVCKQADKGFDLWFATYDVDLMFKRHAARKTLLKYDEICKGFLSASPSYQKDAYGRPMSSDLCSRNLLNYYGQSPIAIQEKHQSALRNFLEALDSGLIGDNRSSYMNYLCNYHWNCQDRMDPYNYQKYAKESPLNVSDLVRVAQQLLKKLSFQDLKRYLEDAIQEVEKGFTADIYNKYLRKWKENAIKLIKERYGILECYADIDSQIIQDFSTLEDKCHHAKGETKTEIEELCLNKEGGLLNAENCHDKLKTILAPLFTTVSVTQQKDDLKGEITHNSYQDWAEPYPRIFRNKVVCDAKLHTPVFYTPERTATHDTTYRFQLRKNYPIVSIGFEWCPAPPPVKQAKRAS